MIDYEEDKYTPPGFNILPEKGQNITIGKQFHVIFNILKIKKDNDDNHHSSTTTKPTKSKPSIYITTVENTSDKYYNQTFKSSYVNLFRKSEKESKFYQTHLISS